MTTPHKDMKPSDRITELTDGYLIDGEKLLQRQISAIIQYLDEQRDKQNAK